MNTAKHNAQTRFTFQPKTPSGKGRSTSETAAPSRTPRVSKIMALAIHLQGLVDSGQVRDYASLARLGHVSRARLTQIMDLTLLAPDIQEALLFLPKIPQGRNRLNERALRGIAAQASWARQRKAWNEICAFSGS